jgi:hypothetical protein
LTLKFRQLPQGDRETPNRESEHYDRYTGPHPRQKRTLVSEMIAGSVGILNHGFLGCPQHYSIAAP